MAEDYDIVVYNGAPSFIKVASRLADVLEDPDIDCIISAQALIELQLFVRHEGEPKGAHNCLMQEFVNLMGFLPRKNATFT